MIKNVVLCRFYVIIFNFLKYHIILKVQKNQLIVEIICIFYAKDIPEPYSKSEFP